ncbi:MAG: glycosyltransferase family 4 protein [Thermodesulfobacteriota bacterium]
MEICFYAPLKPLGHANPSGDLVTAGGIVDFLSRRNHSVITASRLRCRWIYWQPWQWPLILRDIRRCIRRLPALRPELWLTYHTYHKAPDLIGPSVSKRLGIPYVLFQGIYATKRKKQIRTAPGFYLNRRALLSAAHVFTNKRVDFANLKRLLPENRITYVAPGIRPAEFRFDEAARERLRREWGCADAPVVLAAAMFRPGVKTRGLEWVIRSCGRLSRNGQRFTLVVVGDGKKRSYLEQLAHDHLPRQTVFTGKISREELHAFYSAADLFAFPGMEESLGLVYLEAQACGLPVVAFKTAGVPEAVINGETGLLTTPFAADEFDDALATLLNNPAIRREMGETAMRRIIREHDLETNYRVMEETLQEIVRAWKHPDWTC